METHRTLTILGIILLLSTIAIFYYHEESYSDDEFNLAYVTGIAMIIVFMTSLALINKDRFNESKSKK
ncbi:MAG: hypothetical protein COW27_05200 [Nitrosopumilales archaeon CG15_BIG_FIL_POST_REV_8_21_14_020_37_12]|nr:MAG: hypothetical protein COW27_05200 [Nitrosopumilales archaeon CG15_BIG_FIL_POST_REV_8_21_14_020_37_12]